jgi:hypothetical protein
MSSNPKKQLTAEGAILGIIGFILFFDFLSSDAYIFNTQPPQWATSISALFEISPLMIDILATIAVLLVIAMMRTEREIGEME